MNSPKSPTPLRYDFGILLIRLGIGASILLFHGLSKLTGGPDQWTRLGENMALLGIGAVPMFWGFMAAVAEVLGSLLIMLGWRLRIGAAMLSITMAVAALRHISLPPESANAGWQGASHALELLCIYLALLLFGPGRFRLYVGTSTRKGDVIDSPAAPAPGGGGPE